MSYNYNSWEPVGVKPEDLTPTETEFLRDSKTFCIYPWIHMHTYPTGETWPCCHAEMAAGPVGTAKDQSLVELANSERMCQLRLDMLDETKNSYCTRCYEQEEAGFFSGRKSANKHHGHHIKRVAHTDLNTGKFADFNMTYWDVRFSNLCNLKCRSCGHIFSSQWHKDHINMTLLSYWENVKDDSWPSLPPTTEEEFYQLPEKIQNELIKDFHGEILQHIEHGQKLPVLNIAGKSRKDMLEQVLEHIDYVEQIYFAGGEPLVMEEHYAILEELVKRKHTNVRLTYNTNFTQLKLKNKSALEYWKLFPNVSIGASLDAMEQHAEYIRAGTKWTDVEQNIQDLRRECPHVDFYISCTLSIFNALHIVDFHRSWVDKGYIRPQDFNVNILQDPAHYRIDIATPEYKDIIRKRFKQHLTWLEPQDHLNRATTGYQSALNFLNNDNSQLLQKFWDKTRQLDSIRNERVLDYVPELKALQL